MKRIRTLAMIGFCILVSTALLGCHHSPKKIQSDPSRQTSNGLQQRVGSAA